MVDFNATHQVAQSVVAVGDNISQWSVNMIGILLFMLITVTIGFIVAMWKMSLFVGRTWKESEERRAAQINKEFSEIKEIVTTLASKMESLGETLVKHERDDTNRIHAISERVTKVEAISKFVDRRGKPVIQSIDSDS